MKEHQHEGSTQALQVQPAVLGKDMGLALSLLGAPRPPKICAVRWVGEGVCQPALPRPASLPEVILLSLPNLHFEMGYFSLCVKGVKW